MPRPKSTPIADTSSVTAPRPSHYTPAKIVFATPVYVCNASSREPLDMKAIWTTPCRPGSDHKHPSRG